MNDEQKEFNITIKSDDDVNVTCQTLQSIVESEMKAMGLNPHDQNDVNRFWAEKGLLG
jgi:hypothetical protein